MVVSLANKFDGGLFTRCTGLMALCLELLPPQIKKRNSVTRSDEWHTTLPSPRGVVATSVVAKASTPISS